MPRKKKSKLDHDDDKNRVVQRIKAPPKPPPAWLMNCPLQDEDPFLDTTQPPSLAPGPALEACSGADIHYQKASARRQKYLVFLPGLLAFDHQKTASNASKEARSKAAGEASATTNVNDEDDAKKPAASSLTQETNDTLLTQESTTSILETISGDATPSAKATTPAKRATTTAESSNTLKMGHITGLIENTDTTAADSSKPTLTLPLDDRRQLKLEGHKVTTSSKFIVLTIQPKKGRVVCRDVFSSAVVFGNPREIVEKNHDETPMQDAVVVANETKEKVIDISSSLDEEDENLAANKDEDESKVETLEHYGGSCRAWDGSMQGKVSNKLIPGTASNRKKPPPAVASREDIVVEESDNEALFDDNGDDSDEFHMDLSKSAPVAKRSAPRRQSRKKVEYDESKELESSDDDDDSENSVKVQGKKTMKPTSSSEKKVKKAPKEARKSTQKKAATKKESKKLAKQESDEEDMPESDVEVVPKSFRKSLLDDDDDDEDFEMDIGNTTALNKRPPSRRSKTSPPKSYADDDEKGDDSSSDESEDEEPTKKRKSTGKSSKQRKPAKQTTKSIQLSRKSTSAKKGRAPSTDSDDSSVHLSDGSSGDEDAAPSKTKSRDQSEAASKERKTGRLSGGQGSQSNTAKVVDLVDSDSDSSHSDDEDRTSQNIKSNSTNNATKSPPSRRRRRRPPSSGKKDVNAKGITPMHLSDSDGSVEITIEAPPSKKARKKAEESSDEDSDDSFRPPVSKTKKRTASSEKKPSSRKKSVSSKKGSGEKKERENSNQINVEEESSSDDGLDPNSTKLILAKAISRGKAARPSPAKMEEELPQAKETGTPLGTPTRRRRAVGKSPKSPTAKATPRNLADDVEYSFLD